VGGLDIGGAECPEFLDDQSATLARLPDVTSPEAEKTAQVLTFLPAVLEGDANTPELDLHFGFPG